ncbi:hypothetical protein RJT34_10902 [Clitoria ternatea]|uniref:Uncharacterized protein n=1 Tax=Clitoria ternatea TaxID=43366 RepID=A0AAN9JIY3_CLITE
MESHVNLHVIPKSNPSSDTPKEFPLGECFSINFCYTHINQSNTHMPTTISFNKSLILPWCILILCDQVEIDDPYSTIVLLLHGILRSLPISLELLDSILPTIGDCARDMIEHNVDDRELLEMDVVIRVITPSIQVSDEDFLDGSIGMLVNSLEKLGTDSEEFLDSFCLEQCAICLEEFYRGSLSLSSSLLSESTKLIRPNCFHEQEKVERIAIACSTLEMVLPLITFLPPGRIHKDSPAANYLLDHGVNHKDFNSFGSL